MKGKEAVNREHFFQLSSCDYNLRGHSIKLLKQRTSLDVRKFFFSQLVVNEWNLLPQDVVDATSVNQFEPSGQVLAKIWALKAWLN